MSLLDTASLIVTPNGYKEGKLYSVIPSDGSGDLSVTRATTATRVNSQGLVELVPYNLVRYSQEISNTGFWAHYLSNLTANTTTAPDGTNTADTIAITGASGSAYQFVTYSGGIHTLSCYFKKINEDNVYMDGNSSSGYYGASFNLTTQAITLFGGGFLPSIENVGNGWYRCSVQADGSGSGTYGFGVYAGAGQSAYIWGAQLNEGTIKPYQKTETRLNIPRLDYSNGTCPSILVEPQRTNSFTWSEKLLVGYAFAYTSGTFTVTENTTETLDLFGNNNADKFTTAASSINHNDSYNTSNGSGNMTLSIFAKKGIGNAINLYEYNVLSGVGFSTTFDIENGTIISSGGSLVSNSIEDYGNGWYRCSITGPDTSAAGNIHRVTTFEGQTYLFGWQLELNASYPTSYIPTTSASVTRNADVISKTGISSLIGQTEGTLFWDVDFQVVANNDAIFIKDNASYDTFVFMQKESSGIIACGYYGSGALQARIESSAVPTGRYKIAFAYKNNDFVMYLNGTQVGTDTSGTVSGLMDYFDLHWTESGCNNTNASALWKTRLTNTQLAQLTTI